MAADDRLVKSKGADAIAEESGGIDVLVNCVGGNQAEATTADDRSFFDLSLDAVENVMRLNFTRGVFVPSMQE